MKPAISMKKIKFKRLMAFGSIRPQPGMVASIYSTAIGRGRP
jgi:hypothetical protein